MPMIRPPNADTSILHPTDDVPQMMECQRADNDMHGNRSQAAAMRRTNVLQPRDDLQQSIHGDLLLLPTVIARTSCATFVSFRHSNDVAMEQRT
jgi:hypothetical protein